MVYKAGGKMRNIKIPFITLILVVLMSTVGFAASSAEYSQKYHFDNNYEPFNSQEGGLWHRGKGWMYTKPDGTEAIGWALIDGDYHYFDENGWMHVSTFTPDGYYVDHYGVWLPDLGKNASEYADTITGDYVYVYGYDPSQKIQHFRTPPHDKKEYETIHLQKISEDEVLLTWGQNQFDLIKSGEVYLLEAGDGIFIEIFPDHSITVHEGACDYYYSR